MLEQQAQDFAEYLDKEEATWRSAQFFKEFKHFADRYFALGRNKAQLADEAKIDRSIVTRVLDEDESKRMEPSASNLLRLCAVFYNRKIMTSAEGDHLFYLLRYATPTDVHRARMQTTEHRAIVNPRINTDELSPNVPPLPAWARPH